MNKKEIYKKKSNFVAREVDDELVIVPVRDDLADMDYLYTLNETASFVWNRMNGQNSLEDIAHQLTEVYDVDLATALEDVETVIHEINDFVEPATS